MKRFYLCLGLLLLTTIAKVQAQFLGAVTPETNFPLTGVPYLTNNTSAYSYGNLQIGSNLTNLYVYTWDVYGIGSATGSGLAVQQSNPPAQGFNPTGFPTDAESVEAVILQDGTDIFVLCTYYSIGNQGFYLDLYQYLGAGVLQQVAGYPKNITAFAATAPPAWIHLDAHDLNEFIITWQENGQILAKAGTASSGFLLGNTAIVDNGSIGLGPASQPDVALISSLQAGEMAHFVYTNQSENRIVASEIPFPVLLNTPTPLAPLTPIFNDDQQNTNWTFLHPRIDAPDDYAYDDWSYVVRKDNSATNQTLIYTAVENNALGTLFHFNLNDGSLGSLIDISSTLPATEHKNYRPVVAYAPNGKDIYYCWGYLSSFDLPYPPFSDRALIGLKMDNTGQLIQSSSPNEYWRVQLSPQLMSKEPTIALSGENTTSPDLFMAFAQLNSISGNYMTTKNIPWGQTSFRPEGTDSGSDTKDNKRIQIYPNPFDRSFRLKVADNKSNYRLELTDAAGKRILSLNGNAQQLNSRIESAGLEKLSPGDYFLKIKVSGTPASAHFKLLKIK